MVALDCATINDRAGRGLTDVANTTRTVPGMSQRPGSISVVAAFLFAATVIAATVGVSLLGKSPLFERLWELIKPAERAFRAHSTVFGILRLVLSAAALASGVGLLQRRRWA
jgi:hypothetical protein